MLATAVPANAATVTVAAQMGTPADYPLVKSKFGLYNSCLVPAERYDRDLNLIGELNTDHLRIDGGLGGDPNCGYVADPVGGTPGALTYDWDEVDRWVRNLDERQVTPYFSYSYQPGPLQVGGDWRSKPSNGAAYQSMTSTVADHFEQPGLGVGYHEVWNEPDFGTTFFTGTRDEYFDMFRRGVTGIRAGDADAVVGGLSSAYRTAWTTPFLDYVTANDLPLDFLSFHQYPSDPAQEPAAMASYVNHFATAMAGRSRFHTTELHLNEYNSYPINYPQGGTQDKYALASSLLRDYKAALNLPSLDKVSWAQFMDSGMGNYSGMVTIDGHRKAVFNAAKIYGDMPADRRVLTISGATGVDGLAATDEHESGVVLWNKSGSAHTINLTFSGVPFATGNLRVYRIDANNASYGDNTATEGLRATETYPGVATAGRTWTGTLPSNGVVYVKLDDGTGIDGNARVENGSVVRTLSYRPDRNKTSYADFDPTTWSAYLGTASETWTDEEVGATVDGLPARLNVQTRVDGTPQKLDANSCACLRLDYQVGSAFTKSVLFHGPYNGSADLYDAARSAPMPWGTQAQPTQAVAVPNLAQFAVDTAAYAPAGWTGRAQVTFLLQNAGPGVRMTSKVTNGSVAAWGFDEAGGTAAVDRSGSGSTATISNGARAAGVTGSSLTFNGTSTSVGAGSLPAVNFGSGSYSISAWFRTTGTAFQRLVSKGNYGNTDGYLLATHNGGLTFAVGAGGVQSESVGVNTRPGFNDGRWHHVSVVVDDMADTVRVYVDGVIQGLTVGTGYCGQTQGDAVSTAGCDAVASTTAPLTLGSYNATAEFFSGSLDSVRLDRRALTPADVAGIAGQGARPVGRWTFDEGAGPRARDTSGRADHGTVSGGTWTTGQLGGALTLDGTSGSVDVGNVAAGDFSTGSFTIATWFKTTGSSFQRLVSKGNYGNTDGYLLAASGGTVVLAVGASGVQAQSIGLNTASGLDDGQWHHVAAVVDRTAHTVVVYVDGVPSPLTVGTGYCGVASGMTVSIAGCGVNATALGRLTLGSYNGTTEFFAGSLDDTRLYPRALRAGELAGIMAGR